MPLVANQKSAVIKHAYHAMALDEHRKPFNTTLWHFPADGVATSITPEAPCSDLRNKWYELKDKDDVTEQELADAWAELITAEMYDELKGHDSKLLQLWFPGYHINVGGGSDDLLKKKEGDFERKLTIWHPYSSVPAQSNLIARIYSHKLIELSLITLNWMIDQLKPHLSFEINVTDIAQMERFSLMRPVIEELLNTSPNPKRTHWLLKKVDPLVAKLPKTDPWADRCAARNIAAEVLNDWGTGAINDTFEGQVKKAGSEYRSPGEYRETKLQNGQVVKLGRTNEQIHPVVKYRENQLGYKPVSLKDFVRRKKVDGKTVSYEWVKGDVRIPEYKIAKDNWAERQCVQGSAAQEFLGSLDKDYGINTWE